METSATMAGFILRAGDRMRTAEFYQKLGLFAHAHKHGGPDHFELGPTDPDCVAEIYKRTANFPTDAVMVKVSSLDAALQQIPQEPEVKEVNDMRLAYVIDPDGRSVMVYEVIKAEACIPTGLASQTCLPCGGGIPPLTSDEVQEHLSALNKNTPNPPHWWWVSDGFLEKTFVRKNFPDAVSFAAAIVPIAEAEQHHPDVFIYEYKRVDIRLITKAISALSINDFILAAKIDALVK